MHSDVTDDDLSARAPASAVIAEALRAQSEGAPQGRWAALLGHSPLHADTIPWYRGALGELEVARRLERLGSGWHVFHSLPVGERGSDIDHLVIGPAGVFAINTKHHEGGTVWVGSRSVRVNGEPTGYLRNSEYEAKRVARLLAAATADPVEVTPLIVVVGARRLTIRERPAHVVVTEAGRLPGWLRSRPPLLDDTRVEHLRVAASRHATWAATPPARPNLAQFSELRAAVGRARTRRRIWATLGLAAMTGTALLVLPHVPTLVTGVLRVFSP